MGLRWGWEHPPGQQGGNVFTAKRKSARALCSPQEGSRVFFSCSTKRSGRRLPLSITLRGRSGPAPSQGSGLRHAPG